MMRCNLNFALYSFLIAEILTVQWKNYKIVYKCITFNGSMVKRLVRQLSIFRRFSLYPDFKQQFFIILKAVVFKFNWFLALELKAYYEMNFNEQILKSEKF